MDEIEKSDSGDPIYRYSESESKKFEPAFGDGDSIDAISNHIEKCIGPIESVFHEIVSDQVHIDVHWVKPTSKFPFHTLVTSGMSDKPMNIPDNIDAPKYLELCVLLPADWKIESKTYETMEEVFSDERVYWPIRWLKTIARFPHTYQTWVGLGHTIPNGEDGEPFASSTNLGCILLLPSISLPQEFAELKVGPDKTINFLCLCPLYKAEMDFKLEKGTDALLDKFDEFMVSDIVDPTRINVCEKKELLDYGETDKLNDLSVRTEGIKHYELKSGLLDRHRKLVLTEEYVEFENKDLIGQEFTWFNKTDIVDFKHGMDWIVWYKFTVGRQFSVTFKDKRSKELKIIFKSYFGLNSHYHQLYSDIVDNIWKYYHQDIVDKYLDRFYNKEELSFQGLKLNQSGIQLTGQSSVLPWERVEMKEYYRYFAIFDKENPQIHSRVSYNEYETEILWSVIKTMLKNEGSSIVS